MDNGSQISDFRERSYKYGKREAIINCGVLDRHWMYLYELLALIDSI